MTQMRAAKERKRLANPPPEPEPKMLPFHPLSVIVVDKTSAEWSSFDFVSVRDATRRLSVVKRFYEPARKP
jgi:hypothetical protein